MLSTLSEKSALTLVEARLLEGAALCFTDCSSFLSASTVWLLLRRVSRSSNIANNSLAAIWLTTTRFVLTAGTFCEDARLNQRCSQVSQQPGMVGQLVPLYSIGASSMIGYCASWFLVVFRRILIWNTNALSHVETLASLAKATWPTLEAVCPTAWQNKLCFSTSLA